MDADSKPATAAPAHKLRRWRKEQDPPVSGEQLGTMIGVTKFAVSDYETGRRRPRRRTMLKIREVTAGAVTEADFDGALAAVAESGQ